MPRSRSRSNARAVAVCTASHSATRRRSHDQTPRDRGAFYLSGNPMWRKRRLRRRTAEPSVSGRLEVTCGLADLRWPVVFPVTKSGLQSADGVIRGFVHFAFILALWVRILVRHLVSGSTAPPCLDV